MAGFPGRWLETLCFLIGFTRAQFLHQAGPGEPSVYFPGSPYPGPRRGVWRPQTVGRGEARLVWLLEICGRVAVR